MPHRKLQDKSRFPSLPKLLNKLFPDAAIILDDANRENEQEVLKYWELYLNKHEVKYDLYNHPEYEKGMVIIKLLTRK